MKHPIQHVIVKDGIERFQRNEIVGYLIDHGSINLNHINALSHFDREDREQFAQLIGYSVSGAGDLTYFSGDTLDAAHEMAQGKTEIEARLEAALETVERLRALLREPVLVLYGVDPCDP